jgi:hypothetical protein
VSRDRPRIYAAHPITAYGSALERERLSLLRRSLPNAEIFDPAGRYATSVAWRRTWPRVLGTLSGLVVFSAADGSIGTGCLRELIDAMATQLPVVGLDGGGLRQLQGVRLLDDQTRTPRRAAALLLGRVVPALTFASEIE